MKLIGDGVSRCNEKRRDPPDPAPTGAVGSHRAVEQNAIHKILREMGALANDVMDEIVLALRQPRYEPALNRLKKLFRVFGGNRVRGRGEYQTRTLNGPRPCREPPQFWGYWC